VLVYCVFSVVECEWCCKGALLWGEVWEFCVLVRWEDGLAPMIVYLDALWSCGLGEVAKVMVELWCC
jgi:hypothetical protein